jgi:hypothetical protein
MAQLNVGPVLRSSLVQDPSCLPAVVETLGRELGGTDMVVYLVDFGQVVLEPLGDYTNHAELPHSEDLASTMAGRAFTSQKTVTAERAEGFRLWAPVREGSDQTGVLAVTVPDVGPATVQAFEELALFAGYLITTHARVSDLFALHRRRKAMTLAASLQWELLPPLVFNSSTVAVAAFLEPAYEVGGDCFDYAVNGPILDLAIMDSMGHGLNSAVLAGLALGCYRHERRHGSTLEVMHQQLASTVEKFSQGGEAFVTGQLAQLNVETGHLHWTNAGHPPPLHVRDGKVIGLLSSEPTLPWGLEPSATTPVAAAEALEPGDRLLFYTDGVVDSKKTSPENAFGLERLADLAGQTASNQLSPGQVVRRLIRAVVAHHDNELVDDATLLMVEWSGRA